MDGSHVNIGLLTCLQKQWLMLIWINFSAFLYARHLLVPAQHGTWSWTWTRAVDSTIISSFPAFTFTYMVNHTLRAAASSSYLFYPNIKSAYYVWYDPHYCSSPLLSSRKISGREYALVFLSQKILDFADMGITVDIWPTSGTTFVCLIVCWKLFFLCERFASIPGANFSHPYFFYQVFFSYFGEASFGVPVWLFHFNPLFGFWNANAPSIG